MTSVLFQLPEFHSSWVFAPRGGSGRLRKTYLPNSTHRILWEEAARVAKLYTALSGPSTVTRFLSSGICYDPAILHPREKGE